MFEFDLSTQGDKEQLAALEALNALLSKPVQVDVTGNPEQVMSAQALKEARRDFFSANSAQYQACINKYKEIIDDALNTVLAGGHINIESVNQEALDAVRRAYVAVIVENIEQQQAPGGIAPLKPATIKRKGHSKVGIDTGALLEEMRSQLLK